MLQPEPLIAYYSLDDWRNPNYTGNDINRMCKPVIQDFYRGLQRYAPADTNNDERGGNNEDSD